MKKVILSLFLVCFLIAEENNMTKKYSDDDLKFSSDMQFHAHIADENKYNAMANFIVAMENDNYDDIKYILKLHPDLIYMQGIYKDDKDNSFSFLYHIITGEMNVDKKIKLIKFLQDNYKLDLNQICMFIKDKDKLYTYYPLDAILLIMDKKEYEPIKLFKFFAEQRVNAGNSLYYLVRFSFEEKINKLLNENKTDELNTYLKSSEYKNLRNKYKPYFEAIFKNYTASDIYNFLIYRAGEFFINTNDSELLSLLINTLLKDDKENVKLIYDSLIESAIKNKNTSKEILELLKRR